MPDPNEPGPPALIGMTEQDRKKSNLRLALILASIAATFFIGFMVKMVYLAR